MKSKTLFLAFLAVFFFGKTMAQSDSSFIEVDDIPEAEEEAYVDYASNKLDTPVFSLGLQALTMPMGNKQAFGGGISAKVNTRTNRAFGLSLDYLGNSVDEDYGYIVGDPKLAHWNISAFYEYTFLMDSHFQASFRMNVGVSGFSLKDDSIKEIYTWYDEYGNAYEGERAITIDKNIFLRLAPAINLNYKVSKNIALEAQAGYDFYVGGPNFGKISQFNNYMIGAGLVFRINSAH